MEAAIFHLSLFYGDKDKCIQSFRESIEKYKNCKNSDSEKVQERIKHYESILKYITP